MATAKAAVRTSCKRPVALAVIAAGTLLVGYIDLWRGGQTISAFLLSIGYVVLVPIAVMAVPTVKKF